MHTRTRTLTIAGLLVVAASLTACSSPDPYIQEARADTEVPPSVTDEQLLNASKELCGALEDGDTEFQAYLSAIGSWEQFDDEGKVLDIAKKHNCPDA